MSSVLYIKDKGINFTFLSKIEPFEVTKELLTDYDYDLDYELSLSDWALLNSYNLIVFSEDGNIMFYPDKIDNEGYYNGSEKPVNVDYDVKALISDLSSICVKFM